MWLLAELSSPWIAWLRPSDSLWTPVAFLVVFSLRTPCCTRWEGRSEHPCKTETTVFSDLTQWHPITFALFILFVRSKALDVTHTQREWITQSSGYQEVGSLGAILQDTRTSKLLKGPGLLILHLRVGFCLIHHLQVLLYFYSPSKC